MRFRVVQIKSISDPTRSDGEFVDIIHTNSGNLWEGCLSIPKVFNATLTTQNTISIHKTQSKHNLHTKGVFNTIFKILFLCYLQPLGHVDFYPAGGSHQVKISFKAKLMFLQPGCTEICFGLACVNATIDDLIK